MFGQRTVIQGRKGPRGKEFSENFLTKDVRVAFTFFE